MTNNNRHKAGCLRRIFGGGNFCSIILILSFLLFTLGTILPSLAGNPILKEVESGTVTTDSVQTDSVLTDSVQAETIPSPDSIKIYDELGDVNNQY